MPSTMSHSPITGFRRSCPDRLVAAPLIDAQPRPSARLHMIGESARPLGKLVVTVSFGVLGGRRCQPQFDRSCC